MKVNGILGCLSAVALFCAASADAPAADDNFLSLLASEIGRSPSGAERKPQVMMPEGVGRLDSGNPTAKPVAKTVEKEVVVEKPVEKIVEVAVPVTNTVEKIVEKEVVVEKPVEKIVVVERTNVIERVVIVERTNVVEKIVVDKSRENELLERERRLLERQEALLAERDRLAADCRSLSEAKDRQGEQLARERDRRQRLERVIPQEKRQFSDNFLKITAPSTFYDRKDGYAVFQGGVRVRDNQYELRSQRAYVFNDPESNTVSRIVALENVAVTNGPQRAYGVKASYYRKTGMVILYGDGKTPAVVRDESRVDDQEVVGEKIKFWLNSQQVEVLKARIRAPTQSLGEAKALTGR